MNTNASLQDINDVYTTEKYWDDRYKEESDPYEWVGDYSKLKEFDIQKYIKPTDSILLPGCGNSSLARDLYMDGYKNTTSIDLSAVVIEQMKKRDYEYKEMKYLRMDCFDLQFDNAIFDVVIDKSTLDTFLCSMALFDRIPQYFKHVHRVLKNRGYFIISSFNDAASMESVFAMCGQFDYQLCLRLKDEELDNSILKDFKEYQDIINDNNSPSYSYFYVLQKVYTVCSTILSKHEYMITDNF